MGDPIAHSLSPVMHTAAIEALGLDARFVALRTTPAAFPALVHELLEEGGGCSVTRPFKDDAFALAGERSDAATRTRAVNCISGPVSQPVLDNTDVVGIRVAARELMQGGRVDRTVIAGTGGSARAAALAVAAEWPGSAVEVVSRSLERRAEFEAWATGAGVSISQHGDGARLVINATPVAEVAVDVAGNAYLDLKYSREVTPAVRAARRGADGRGVLLHQGVAAFERFFGLKAPVEVMRRAVEDALRP